MLDFLPNEEIFSAVIKRSFLLSRRVVFVDGRSWAFLISSWNSRVSICIFCTWWQLIKQLDIVNLQLPASNQPGQSNQAAHRQANNSNNQQATFLIRSPKENQ